MLHAPCPRQLLAVAVLSLAAGACRGRDPMPPGKKGETRIVWHPVGTWSGHGNRQTESFDGATGALRVRWDVHSETPQVTSSSFRLTAHSAISGRELAEVVNRQDPGSGVGYVSTEPHTFYIAVESSGMSWTFSVDEGITGEVVPDPRR